MLLGESGSLFERVTWMQEISSRAEIDTEKRKTVTAIHVDSLLHRSVASENDDGITRYLAEKCCEFVAFDEFTKCRFFLVTILVCHDKIFSEMSGHHGHRRNRLIGFLILLEGNPVSVARDISVAVHDHRAGSPRDGDLDFMFVIFAAKFFPDRFC